MKFAEYRVIYTTEDGALVRADFRDYDSASKFAKAHDSVVIRVDNSDSAWDTMKFRAFNVGVVLTIVTVLSAVAWGWIDCLCGAGLI